MLRRRHNLVWLFVALTVLAQSLLPVATLAEISVRCVGTSAASPPCAHMVVSLDDRRSITSRLSVMPCCRDMASCRAMTGGCDKHARGAARFATLLSAPKCLITVNTLGITTAVTVPSMHRWLLHSAPAQAPPRAHPRVTLVAHSNVAPVSPLSFNLKPRLRTTSHGLRAPPIA